MKAEIISIGTELLLGETVDTNTAEISTSMAQLGIGVYYHQTVGDNPGRMTEVVETAVKRSDIVIITGGLGPTEDDITREIVAKVANKPLVLNDEGLAHVQSFFKNTGRQMTENNKRQAYAPEGAILLQNDFGTAPGIYVQFNGKHIFCLPGVPSEMRGMWKKAVIPHLLRLTGGGEGVIVSRILRFYGIGESELETRVKHLLQSSNPTVAPYAGDGEVRLRITALGRSEEEARTLITPMEERVTEAVGDFIYGHDEDSLESVVGSLLLDAKSTIATAESCTGGLIAHRLTNVPGSSAYFKQGFVVYSNEAKVGDLGVDPSLLERYGAVSAEVAEAMARGALKRSGADVALAVTGIAGPGGGTVEKPVGLVWFALALGDSVQVFERRFGARSRDQIKSRSAVEGLNIVRLGLLGRG